MNGGPWKRQHCVLHVGVRVIEYNIAIEGIRYVREKAKCA